MKIIKFLSDDSEKCLLTIYKTDDSNILFIYSNGYYNNSLYLVDFTSSTIHIFSKNQGYQFIGTLKDYGLENLRDEDFYKAFLIVQEIYDNHI